MGRRSVGDANGSRSEKEAAISELTGRDEAKRIAVNIAKVPIVGDARYDSYSSEQD